MEYPKETLSMGPPEVHLLPIEKINEYEKCISRNATLFLVYLKVFTSCVLSSVEV